VFIHDSGAERDQPLRLGRLAIPLVAHIQIDALLLVLPSGTRWKKSRGSTSAGSEQAPRSRNADRAATVIMSSGGSRPVATTCPD
jgi:hypothetical protein